MNTIEAIMTRRSVRQFTDETVTAEQLETLLRAAMAAPSAGNQQPWRFVVARDEAIRAKLAAATPYSSPIGRAPVGLVVFGDTRGNKRGPSRFISSPCTASSRRRTDWLMRSSLIFPHCTREMINSGQASPPNWSAPASMTFWARSSGLRCSTPQQRASMKTLPSTMCG